MMQTKISLFIAFIFTSVISVEQGKPIEICATGKPYLSNKVIFVYNHDRRVDFLKNNDGIFDEFTYAYAP